jgi:hypothetical protein
MPEHSALLFTVLAAIATILFGVRHAEADPGAGLTAQFEDQLSRIHNRPSFLGSAYDRIGRGNGLFSQRHSFHNRGHVADALLLSDGLQSNSLES